MKIKRRVVEDYPAARLPGDLLGDINPAHQVRVTIEDRPKGSSRSSLRSHFGAAKNKDTSIQEAVARVRRLRDE